MATYDYECRKCRRKFTIELSVIEHETKKVRCPKCASTSVRRRIEEFFALTAKKS